MPIRGNHALWGLAIDRGLFDKDGLSVSMDRGYGSGDTIVKVASGAYDIGFADINALVKFNAQNPDKRCIAVYQGFDRTLSAIISLTKAGIKQPSDLPGHTLGAPDADASRLLFPVFAQKNGIDAARVSWKSIAPNLRETILVQGQVDAISGFTTTSLLQLARRRREARRDRAYELRRSRPGSLRQRRHRARGHTGGAAPGHRRLCPRHHRRAPSF